MWVYRNISSICGLLGSHLKIFHNFTNFLVLLYKLFLFTLNLLLTYIKWLALTLMLVIRLSPIDKWLINPAKVSATLLGGRRNGSTIKIGGDIATIEEVTIPHCIIFLECFDNGYINLFINNSLTWWFDLLSLVAEQFIPSFVI